MEYQYQYLDIKIPTKEPENGLVDVVNSVRPSWDKDKLDIKLLSGGFINKMYGIHLKSDSNIEDGLVIRVNTESTIGLGADRETELRTLLALNERDIGVPVLASFRNGIVFKFLKGQPLNDDQMRDKHIMSLIAVELAKMHTKLPLGTDPRANPLYLTRMAFDHVPKTLKDPEKQSRYIANIPYSDFATETLELHEHLLGQDLELAIGHGDLWQGNIMYHEEQDTLTFIDYEQSGFHFAAWDIAFYLVTLAGTPPDYKNHYPSEEDKRYFIQHYLQKKIRISKDETCVEDTYDKKLKVLYVQVCKCELLALLHLVNQCLYCETVLDTDILLTDFDFMGMATNAWNEYKSRKEKYMKMVPEEVYSD